jgi:hypothetical protein
MRLVDMLVYEFECPNVTTTEKFIKMGEKDNLPCIKKSEKSFSCVPFIKKDRKAKMRWIYVNRGDKPMLVKTWMSTPVRQCCWQK